MAEWLFPASCFPFPLPGSSVLPTRIRFLGASVAFPFLPFKHQGPSPLSHLRETTAIISTISSNRIRPAFLHPSVKMKTSVAFVLATWAALAAASVQPGYPAPEVDSTTTLTSTVTSTYTLTECETDVPDCPINKKPTSTPTPEILYPTETVTTSAKTKVAYPTSSSLPSTSVYAIPVPTSTAVSNAIPKPPVVVAGASDLLVSKSLVLGLAAIGAVLLA
jgi:hypothetical protein